MGTATQGLLQSGSDQDYVDLPCPPQHKDYEQVPETTEAWFYVGMTRLMLGRLAHMTMSRFARAKAT